MTFVNLPGGLYTFSRDDRLRCVDLWRQQEQIIMQVEQLKAEIALLTDADFARLRRWFADKDWERWD